MSTFLDESVNPRYSPLILASTTFLRPSCVCIVQGRTVFVNKPLTNHPGTHAFAASEQSARQTCARFQRRANYVLLGRQLRANSVQPNSFTKCTKTLMASSVGLAYWPFKDSGQLRLCFLSFASRAFFGAYSQAASRRSSGNSLANHIRRFHSLDWH